MPNLLLLGKQCEAYVPVRAGEGGGPLAQIDHAGRELCESRRAPLATPRQGRDTTLASPSAEVPPRPIRER